MTASTAMLNIESLATFAAHCTVGLPPAEDVISAALTRYGSDHRQVLNDVRPQYAIMYVLRGNGIYTDWRGIQCPLTSGMVFQRYPERPFGIWREPDGQWMECSLRLPRSFAEGLELSGSLDPRQPVLRPGLSLRLVDRFHQLSEKIAQTPALLPARLLADAHDLLATILEAHTTENAHTPHAQMVQEACRLLSENLHERLDLREFNKRFSIGHERFRKVFKEHTGLAPKAYRIRCRLDRAQDLLTTTDLGVKEIAADLGYASVPSFTRQFAQSTGYPPAAFRDLR